jgi:hypothetical protein
MMYSTGANTGFILWTNGGAFNQARYTVCNNAGGFAIDAVGAVGTFAAGVPKHYAFRFADGAGTPEYQLYVAGAQEASGDAVPGSNAPQFPLHLGGRAGGSSFSQMRWRDLYYLPDTAQAASTSAAYQLTVNGLAA